MNIVLKRLAALTATIAMTAAGFTGIALPAQAATTVPATPSSLKLASGTKSLTASWTAPAQTADTTVTGYRIQYSTSNTFPATSTTTLPIASTSTTYTITGLADATTYYVKVAATNSAGASPNTLGVAGKTWNTSIPSTPSAPRATAGARQVSVSWTAPALPSGASPVSGYRVQYSTDSTFATGVSTLTTSTTNTSELIGGLSDNTVYYVRVAATNAAGTSSYSAGTSVKTLAVPAEPGAPTVTSSLRQLTVKWTAPASNGGSPITGYTIQYSTDSTFAANVQSLNVGNLLTANLTGLSSSTKYYVRVAAVNAAGSSDYSLTGNGSTYGPPNSPTALTATAGAGLVMASWITPTSTGGSPITGYTIQYSTDSTFATGSSFFAAKASPALIPGLEAGKTYYLQVSATNAAGTSQPSNTATATTYSAPAGPTKVTATAGGSYGALNIKWAAPTNTGGAPISGYTIQYSDKADYSTSSIVNLSGTGTAATITGLPNGTTYYVRVAAKTAAGTSAYVDAALPATTLTATSAPVALNVTRGIGSLTVSWVAPTSASANITGYKVLLSTNPTSAGAISKTVTGASTTSTTLTGLTSGTTYYITVAATTNLGLTSYSPLVSASPYHQLPAPNDYTVTSTGNNGFIATWSPVVDVNVPTITSYQLQYSKDATFASNVTTVALGSNDTDYTATGLTAGATYYVRIAAVSSFGASPNKAAGTVYASASPASITSLAVEAVDLTSANLSWTAGANNGMPITSYAVTANPSDGVSITYPVDRSQAGATITGLTPGVSYTFDVTATNANGDSPVVTSSSFSTATAADAPSTPVVSITSLTSLTATWLAPITHGAAIDSYTVQYSTDATFASNVTTVSGVVTTSYTLTQLTAGTRYYVRVSADSAAGQSSASNAGSQVPGTAPETPSEPSATLTGLTAAHLSWTAPESNGYPITSYTVTVSPSDGVTLTYPTDRSQTGATLSGMTAGTTYTFTVKAINARGTSSTSMSSSITAPALADAPSELAVEAGTRQITPTWTAPADNGAAITGYTLQYSTSAAFASNVVTVNDAVSGEAITGLANNTTYYVRVAAVNAVGIGANSVIVNAVTNAISSAPANAAMTFTGVTGSTEPRTSSADLTWTAPVNDGRTPIASYTVSVSPAAGVSVTYPTDRSQTGATLSGLTAGTTYTFTVRATNSAGTSTASAASAAMTAPDVTTAPTNVASTVTGTTTADVTWDAPGLDNGAAVTDYVVTATPSAGLTIDHTGTATIAHISGLTNGTNYVFTVVAVNAVGRSAAASSDSNLIATAPEAPAAPTLEIASGTSLTATWNTPEANGSPITGYTLQYSKDSTFTTGITTVTNANRGGTLSGLTIGSVYYVRVKAGNSVGFSSYSPTASLKPGTAPSAPAKPSASLTGLTTATVTWSAPASNGYSITGYTVTATPSAGLTIVSSGTTASVTGMTAGTTYTFTVKATNALGTSSESTASTAVTTADIPDAPAAPAVTATGLTTTDLSVTAPANNGSAITGYSYQISTDSTFETGVALLTGGATVQATGLTNGSTYYFRAAAVNAVGQGPWSASTSNLIAMVPSAVPTPSVVVASATTVNPTWTAPAANGSPITSYTLQYTPDSTFATDVTTVTNATSGMTISGLTTGTRYYVRVKANNIVGSGAYSTTGSQVPGAAPAAPVAPTATLTGLTTASLTWSAPNANGYAITSYTVTASPSAGVTIAYPTDRSQTDATVTGLSAGTSYTFAVTATNALGTSAPSSDIAASNVITTPDVTSAPTAVSVSVTGLTTATVTWTAPTNINGSAITGYVVTATPSAGVTISNSGTAISANVTGLTNGTSYVFSVKAVNAVGQSAAGSSSSTLIATAPSVPTTPSVAITSISSVTPTWTAPAANGSPITGYTLQYSTDSTFATGVTTVSNATSGTAITGLTTGMAYYFQVKATNAIGSSAYSTAGSQIPGSAPSTPTGMTVSVAPATSVVTANWTAPAANGYAITGYTLQYSTDSTFATGVVEQSIVAPSVTASTSALTKGSTYYFRVKAANTLGFSAASASASILVPAAPSAPTSLAVSTNTGSTLNVSWAAPAANGSPITGYTVQYSTSSTFTSGTLTATTTATSLTLTGLTVNTTYYVRVLATNAVGNSSYSSTSSQLTVYKVSYSFSYNGNFTANQGGYVDSISVNGTSIVANGRAFNSRTGAGVTSTVTGSANFTTGSSYYWSTTLNSGITPGTYTYAFRSRFKDRLEANECLTSGEMLMSVSNSWVLTMQSDGNLVLRDIYGAQWQSGKYSPGAYFCNQGDGNLVEYSSSNVAIWASGSRGAGSFVVQDDGHMVLYPYSGGVAWASGTNYGGRPDMGWNYPAYAYVTVTVQ